MSRIRNNGATSVNVEVKVASALDLGYQFTIHGERGGKFVEAALAFCPVLEADANDKSDDAKAFWDQITQGAMKRWDQKFVHYAVRHEDATYTLESTGDDKDRITANMVRAGVKESESPTLHAILKSLKNPLDRYLADRRRDLKDAIKRYLRQKEDSAPRSPNKEYLEWMAKTMEAIERKTKTALSKQEIEQDTVNGVRAWLKSFDGYMGA